MSVSSLIESVLAQCHGLPQGAMLSWWRLTETLRRTKLTRPRQKIRTLDEWKKEERSKSSKSLLP